ncbi:RBBP9/YdeN family alpha/beta hydrolase [Aquabacterium sp.]|uniref:RBBP9/YdeN family alpha/beta hydrolase n=1 Tax=Aquabacterium sp. TaxID=1872578 RepID=UPI0035B1EB82
MLDQDRLHVLVLPGWQDSGPAHWQSRWALLHADEARFTRVEQDDWQQPLRGDWMMRLDETLLAQVPEQGAPVVLVAHSLGCHLVAAWAAHSGLTGRVRAALLVAPPDLDGPDAMTSMPPQLHGWRRVVRQALPFPALMLASSNDPYGSLARSAGLAADWGADFGDLGPAGHVNADAGFGDWPAGWARWQAWLGTQDITAAAD